MTKQCYSLKDIASLAGVGSTVVSNWKRRDPNFPQPDYANADESVILFEKETVETYLNIRFSNLKKFLTN